MSPIERRIRDAVNPISTAAARWWCHSALRHMLAGYGPTARQRRLIRDERVSGAVHRPSPEQMSARRAAVDRLFSEDRRES